MRDLPVEAGAGEGEVSSSCCRYGAGAGALDVVAASRPNGCGAGMPTWKAEQQEGTGDGGRSDGNGLDKQRGTHDDAVLVLMAASPEPLRLP